MNPSIASSGAARFGRSAGAAHAAYRLQQQQQQVPATRRHQQQQGSTDFQPVPHDVVAPQRNRPVPAAPSDRPAAARDGGHGGTPVGRLQNGTDTAGDTKSYIDEASMNVDA